MPRPERPLDPDDGAVQRFAGELRELRRRAGKVTYRQLAERSGYAVTTLSEAAGGRRLPTLDVALAYAMACGGDEEEWKAKWRAAALTAAESRCPQGRDRPPYRGLRSFRTEDADLFFGRDQLVAEVVRQVSAQRVTVLCGPSGSGKTSLLMAGVLPALCPSLRPVVIKPGECLPDSAGLLVVDQVEELYARSDAREVLDRILARDRVLLCVRADFAARLAEYPQVVVGPMDQDALNAAITKPALAVGLSVERALSVTILNEANGQVGALPLLSHALLETWQRRRGEVLTLAGFTAAGGIGCAVAQMAEAAYRELDAVGQRLAAGLLLRLLAVDEETGAVTLRRLDLATLLDVDPDAGQVIDHLANARLVVVDRDTAEIAHGSVLTAWPRMCEWINDHREALQVHRTITEAARSWSDGVRDPAALATGTRLATMCSYAVSGTAPFRLSQVEREFLQESVAQTKRAAASARRRTNRLRVVTAVAVVLALVAGVLAVVASTARTDALTARDNALSRQTALTAATLRATDPGLAAQLAIAGYRIAQTDEARSELLKHASAPVPARYLGGAGPTALDASADGALVAVSDATNGSVRLLTKSGDHLTRTGVIEPWEPGAAKGPMVYALALSPDARTLAIGDMQSTITLWDVSDPRNPRRLAVPIHAGAGPIERLDIDPTGGQLAAAGGDGILRWTISDPANPRPLAPLPAPAKTKTVVYGSGGLLAFGTQSGGVHLWRATENAAELAVLDAGDRAVPALSFSPDGRVLVAGSLDRALRSWDISTPTAPVPARSLTDLFDLKITTTAFSPDGAHLVVGSADSTLRVLDTTTWATVEVLNHPDVVTWAVFSDNGESIMSAATDGAARVWKLDTALPRRANAPIFDTRFNASGRRLAVFAEGGVTLWNTTNPADPAPLTGTLTGADAVFSGAGDLSGDGNLLAAGTIGGEVQLLDVSDPERPRLRARLGGSQEQVVAVAFSPDRSKLAAGGYDSSIRVWDVTGKEPRLVSVLDAPREVVLDLDWNNDGTLLAVASADSDVYLFDFTGPPHLRARLEGLDSYVYSAEFSQSGEMLAIAGVDSVVVLWDVRDEPVRIGQPISGPAGRIFELAFQPRGDLLAASVIDGSTWLWNVSDPANPVRTAVLSAGPSPLNTAVFHPAGDLLVTGGSDRRLRLWRTDENAVVTAICTGVGDPITEREWRAHLPDVPYAPPCPPA
ncbi:helix-turn-helix domain-containing protein [Lentzea sp. NPDC005914]|uniref:nSTAND1 domain-containing NTPase n=1 Tax=Lentzea sp. NPDC005914 TaxID=3154572 RepID=UPI0033DB2FC7